MTDGERESVTTLCVCECVFWSNDKHAAPFLRYDASVVVNAVSVGGCAASVAMLSVATGAGSSAAEGAVVAAVRGTSGAVVAAGGASNSGTTPWGRRGGREDRVLGSRGGRGPRPGKLRGGRAARGGNAAQREREREPQVNDK